EYFKEEEVDFAVVEVGLGGRLDATNVVDPMLSVITSISYEHTNFLGNTLTKIAGEKGGIIKPGKTVVVSPQKEEALTVFEQLAKEKYSQLVRTGIDNSFELDNHSLQNQTFRVWQNGKREGNLDAGTKLTIPLLGHHQVENAATAYAVLMEMKKLGVKLQKEQIQDGFALMKWPGRFEILNREPLVIIDSAHNQDAAAKLRQTLEDYLPGKKVVLLFGASEDKDVKSMYSELLPYTNVLIASESIHPRAMEAAKLIEYAMGFDVEAIASVPMETAMKIALSKTSEQHPLLITGSLFVAGAAREIWDNGSFFEKIKLEHD
ncbi:MAG: hypothetical protein JEZ06_22080, partial [Anaerolineaceae bacterium]|nr:hypothetical protein [Anaerolineaceae bacterium]